MARGGGNFRTWFALLGFAAPVLLAQIPVKSTFDAGDGIAGAKRELDAVKAAAVPGVKGIMLTFDDFLAALSANRRKTIKRERRDARHDLGAGSWLGECRGDEHQRDGDARDPH